jgi:hypothetical protein
LVRKTAATDPMGSDVMTLCGRLALAVKFDADVEVFGH